MGEESAFHFINIPHTFFTIQQISNHLQINTLSSRATHFEGDRNWEPPILPNLDLLPISYDPSHALLKDIPCNQYTPPCIRRIPSQFGPIKLEFLKYLALYTLWIREEVFWSSRHPCFARSAKLNAFKSLKPIPSSIFLVHILSHDTQAIFLLLPCCPPPKTIHHGV